MWGSGKKAQKSVFRQTRIFSLVIIGFAWIENISDPACGFFSQRHLFLLVRDGWRIWDASKLSLASELLEVVLGHQHVATRRIHVAQVLLHLFDPHFRAIISLLLVEIFLLFRELAPSSGPWRQEVGRHSRCRPAWINSPRLSFSVWSLVFEWDLLQHLLPVTRNRCQFLHSHAHRRRGFRIDWALAERDSVEFISFVVSDVFGHHGNSDDRSVLDAVGCGELHVSHLIHTAVNGAGLLARFEVLQLRRLLSDLLQSRHKGECRRLVHSFYRIQLNVNAVFRENKITLQWEPPFFGPEWSETVKKIKSLESASSFSRMS